MTCYDGCVAVKTCHWCGSRFTKCLNNTPSSASSVPNSLNALNYSLELYRTVDAEFTTCLPGELSTLVGL